MEFMTRGKQFLTLGCALLGGFAYFGLLMGLTQALMAANAASSPTIPWFPIPTLLAIVIATALIARRWEIRLNWPDGDAARRRKLYLCGLTGTFTAMCIAVLEDAYFDLTRVPVDTPEGVSAAFVLSVLIVIPLIASILAEVGFRGIMQTRFERVLPLWPTLLILAVLNALFHLYDPEQSFHWARFLALNISFGYITWLARSIVPALIAHIAMNVVEPVSEFVAGPVPMGELAAGTLAVAGLLGIGALVITVALARNIIKEQINVPDSIDNA
jgi:membrane protease YdiL (CAAX protease family)